VLVAYTVLQCRLVNDELIGAGACELDGSIVAVVCRLYTVSGVRVHSSSDLEFNGRYVAVGRYGSFQRLNYGAAKPAFSANARYQPRCFNHLSPTVVI